MNIDENDVWWLFDELNGDLCMRWWMFVLVCRKLYVYLFVILIVVFLMLVMLLLDFLSILVLKFLCL